MVQSVIDKKLYPIPAECQRGGDAEVPLRWALAYLKQIYEKVPEGERDKVVMRGWAHVAIFHEGYVRDAAEVQAERTAMLLAAVQRVANGETVTADDAKALLAALTA